MNTIKQTKSSPLHQVLDPCLLGRPVHLLHTFTLHLRDDLSALFANINRRYKAAFKVGDVTLTRMDKPEGSERWVAYRASQGQIAFSLERKVLLSVLDYRYGRRIDATPAAQSGDAVRITATEERLAVSLGMQLAETLAARVDAWEGAAAQPHDFTSATTSPPRKGAWTVCVVLEDTSIGMQGKLWFTLDEAWMARLLRGLAPARDKLNKPLANTQPLAARLQVTLTGHLMSKEMLLGELLDVRVGDVIPISLGRTDVLLDDSRLFTAAVAEHQGKLCLTSFEDVE
ncbi:FliM/FliN family flagellar motor switch protein [Noviherbaspirillum cavernae]|uniref:FliM/FliN family flagellar motor switch protein n=1 Tax=Noviherbaspirillum cavernae TaxID=2320862 RepID=A0A418WVU0_9BURK|nr:FliM/FliN family flagellar motor C-terminal domain-containing protein [Noviherbaspirillum cavernae]RJF96709.1 FliM/FliN family flagellar motor switch protein [Noviherbaspirillum cavernae]